MKSFKKLVAYIGGVLLLLLGFVFVPRFIADMINSHSDAGLAVAFLVVAVVIGAVAYVMSEKTNTPQ